jgi:hypothetical protein
MTVGIYDNGYPDASDYWNDPFGSVQSDASG